MVSILWYVDTLSISVCRTCLCWSSIRQLLKYKHLILLMTQQCWNVYVYVLSMVMAQVPADVKATEKPAEKPKPKPAIDEEPKHKTEEAKPSVARKGVLSDNNKTVEYHNLVESSEKFEQEFEKLNVCISDSRYYDVRLNTQKVKKKMVCLQCDALSI